MSITFNDTSTRQGLVQDLRFLSGQDSLSIEDATRLLNFAVDDYWHLRVSAAGERKPDSTTYTDRPYDTTSVDADTDSIELDNDHLMIDEFQIDYDGKRYKLDRISATKEDDPVAETYATNGRPKYYDVVGNTLYLYPATDEAITAHIWYIRQFKHFATTDTTVDIGIPQVHGGYLSLRAAQRLGFRTGDRQGLEAELRRLVEQIKEFSGMQDMNSERRLQPKNTTKYE